MKKTIIAISLSFLVFSCGGNDAENMEMNEVEEMEKSEKMGLDITDPKSVVEQIFVASQSGDLSSLTNLCDPNGENDGDTKKVCAVSSTSDDEQKEFISYFKTGKITGEVTIDGDMAKVPIKFGPNGDKDETIKLVKRGNNWYLYSF